MDNVSQPNVQQIAQSRIEIAAESGDSEFRNALVKHVLKRFYNRIEASDEQKKEISEIVDNRMVANQSKRQAMRAGIKDFFNLSATLDNSQNSAAALKAKAHELRLAHQQLMDDRLETFLKIRALLSDEQRQKLQKSCQNRFKRISAMPFKSNMASFVSGELI